MDTLHDHIVIAQLGFIDCFIFLLRISFGKENLYRHEGAVFTDDLAHPIFICKFQAVIGKEERDLCTNFRAVPFVDGIFCAAVALPVYRLCILLPGEGIDVNFVGYHKYRIKTKAEMSDDLILCCFILIFIQKVSSTGKCNLRDIFLDLCSCHAKTGINKFQCFFIRVDDDFYFLFVILRVFVFAHHLKLCKLCDRVAAVGNYFTDEDVMVGIQPFFDNRKNVFTVDGKTSCSFTHIVTTPFYMFQFFIQGEAGLPESIVSALRIPVFFDRLLTLMCMIILIEQKVKKKLALIFSEC